MFLRKSRIEPLPVTMSAIRMGERVLQVGIDDPGLAGALAAKAGLTGTAAIVVADQAGAARARAAAASAGVLVDVHVSPPAPLPFDAAAFDLVILHNIDGRLAPLGAGTRTAAVRECYRVLRTGGRIMAIEAGAPSGLRALLRQSQPSQGHETTGDITVALEAAGFRPVRVLADREGYRFTEGIKSSEDSGGPSQRTPR